MPPVLLPTLVGEDNPYGSDPYYALYPAPDGCSGHRLCCLILGMRRADYLRLFRRANLCDTDRWTTGNARESAERLQQGGDKCVLLGAKVSRAFGLPFRPFTMLDHLLILPHPSGRNPMWNDGSCIARTRMVVGQFLPSLRNLLGPGEVPCHP